MKGLHSRPAPARVTDTQVFLAVLPPVPAPQPKGQQGITEQNVLASSKQPPHALLPHPLI